MSRPLSKVQVQALSPVRTLALSFGNVVCPKTPLGISEGAADATAGFNV